MLDHTDHTAPTRQHDGLDHTEHTDHTDHTDQECIYPSALKYLDHDVGSIYLTRQMCAGVFVSPDSYCRVPMCPVPSPQPTRNVLGNGDLVTEPFDELFHLRKNTTTHIFRDVKKNNRLSRFVWTFHTSDRPGRPQQIPRS